MLPLCCTEHETPGYRVCCVFEQVSNPTAASESALAQLADGTLTAIMRMDGDCGCGMTESRGECGVYRWYHQSFSSE